MDNPSRKALQTAPVPNGAQERHQRVARIIAEMTLSAKDIEALAEINACRGDGSRVRMALAKMGEAGKALSNPQGVGIQLSDRPDRVVNWGIPTIIAVAGLVLERRWIKL